MTLTSFGLEVGDAVHDDMVKEQGFVVDLDVSGEQATEVLHIPEKGKNGEKEDMNMPPPLSNCTMVPNVLHVLHY